MLRNRLELTAVGGVRQSVTTNVFAERFCLACGNLYVQDVNIDRGNRRGIDKEIERETSPGTPRSMIAQHFSRKTAVQDVTSAPAEGLYPVRPFKTRR